MRFIYLILFILAVNTAQGSVIKKPDPKPVKATVLQTDTSNVKVRSFDSAALKKYSKQPDFQYREEKETLSWWDRFWIWFWNWFAHLFNFRGASFFGAIWAVIEILLIVGGAIALIYFIFKASGMDIKNIFRRKPTSAPIPYSEFFEDINTIDFDAEIENAVAKHNYRFAVRLLYLKCLKQLSDAGLIAWQLDKTNSTYINELSNNEQQAAFKILTRQFEYVWYGEFLIDGAVYNTIAGSFIDFNRYSK